MRLENIALEHAEVPKQLDQWSCGHRAILTVQLLLQKGLGLRTPDGWLRPMSRMVIAEEEISASALDGVCAGKMPAMPVKKEPPRLVKAPVTTAAIRPCTPIKVKADIQAQLDSKTSPVKSQAASRRGSFPQTTGSAEVAPPSRSQQTEPGLSKSSPMKQEAKPEPKPTKKSPPKGQAKPEPKPSERVTKDDPAAQNKSKLEKSDDDMDMSFEDALSQKVSEILELRQTNLIERKKMQRAKNILSKSGLDFNMHFQKKHAAKLEKGHWHAFLLGVVGEPDPAQSGNTPGLSCVVCRSLLHEFKIHEFADMIKKEEEEKERNKKAGKRVKPEGDENTDPNAMDMVPYTGQPEPLYKRMRPGRPCRGETTNFDALKFLSEHRPGMYKILTRDEARRFQIVPTYSIEF